MTIYRDETDHTPAVNDRICVDLAERSYEVKADPEVNPGGVVIDTRAGVVDAQIETQLDEIARAIGALPDLSTMAE